MNLTWCWCLKDLNHVLSVSSHIWPFQRALVRSKKFSVGTKRLRTEAEANLVTENEFSFLYRTTIKNLQDTVEQFNPHSKNTAPGAMMDHYVATSIFSALLEEDCCPGGPWKIYKYLLIFFLLRQICIKWDTQNANYPQLHSHSQRQARPVFAHSV